MNKEEVFEVLELYLYWYINYDKIVEYINNQDKEIERLRNTLEYVMEQVYGAMTKNWCIDWNFTAIRETFNIPNRFDEEDLGSDK